MEKTPEEIKRAMNGCHSFGSCSNCPYFSFSATLGCKTRRNADALAYIQQLEAANAEMLTKAEKLEAKCHQLERERDAAVADLRISKDCRTCKHATESAEEEPCYRCGIRQSAWEWRGVKED